MIGEGRSTQIVVLSTIAALIIALCAVVVIDMERNRSALLEAVGIPAPPPPDARMANARLKPGDLQAALGWPENYPDDARSRGEQGSVAAKLTIAPSGVVDDCRVTKSSGFASLDEATCRVVQREVRFTPARDSQGRAIQSDFVLRVRWVLPE